MANSLEAANPAAPNPNENANNALQQGGQQQQQSAAPAPPTHAQTVAALRHFDAIKNELTTILKNPTLGKADVKSQIIDGVTKLVSERMMKPADAVIQLSQVPTDPLQQKKWAQTQFSQAMQAEQAILAHHAQGFAGQGPEPTPSRDDQMDHMAALHSNYGGK